MTLTKEQVSKLKSAKSVEELSLLAKEEGIYASDAVIKAQFDSMHSEGVLADEELDNVSGGGSACILKNDPPTDHNPNAAILVRIKATGETGERLSFDGYYGDTPAYWILLDSGTTKVYLKTEYEELGKVVSINF